MKQEQGIIFKTLDGFHRVELEDIMHFFGAEIPARLRKREFVERLGAYLIGKPREWLHRMLERDLRLLQRLVDMGPGNSLCLEYPDYPSVLETVQLVHSDVSDADFRRLWIGPEVYDIVAPHIAEVLEERTTSGRFDRERAALGYLNLYGVMSVRDFIHWMLAYQQFDPRLDERTFMDELYDGPVMNICRFDFGTGRYLSAPSIFEPEEILKGRKEYAEVSEDRSFLPEEALEAGKDAPYFVFGLDTPQGKELVAMLQELGYEGDGLLREVHDIWMNSQHAKEEDSTEAVFSSVARKQDEIASFAYFNACMQKVAAFANSLPKWLLRGHSPDEVNYLKVILQSEEDPIRELVDKDPLLGLFVPPAPADAPCPCGSGLLYRNCHGRRLS